MEPRYYEANAAGSAPLPLASPSEGYPSNGNPAEAVPATTPGAYWYLAVGEEIRNVILEADLTPDYEDLSQLTLAILALINNAISEIVIPDIPEQQDLTDLLVKPGTVIASFSSSPPTGYLAPNGAVVSRTTFAALFAAIGTVGGVGDGSTTFNLPTIPSAYTLGQADGNLGAASTGQNKSHSHTVTAMTGACASGSGPCGYGSYSAYQTGATTDADSSGGAANLAAAVMVNFFIKY